MSVLLGESLLVESEGEIGPAGRLKASVEVKHISCEYKRPANKDMAHCAVRQCMVMGHSTLDLSMESEADAHAMSCCCTIAAIAES